MSWYKQTDAPHDYPVDYAIDPLTLRSEIRESAREPDVNYLRCQVADGEAKCTAPSSLDRRFNLRLCATHLYTLERGFVRAIYTDDDFRRGVEMVLESIARMRDEKWTRPEPRTDKTAVVYFVEREGRIKIGWSSNLPQRLQGISTGSCLIAGMTVGPVKLLGTMPGTRQEEKDLHRRFAHLRIGGEWFRPEPDLRAFIAALSGSVA